MKISIKYVIPILGSVLSATDQIPRQDLIRSASDYPGYTESPTAKSGSKVGNGSGSSDKNLPSK